MSSDRRAGVLAPLLAGAIWFGGLYALYSHWPGLARWFIEEFTVRPAAWTLQGLAPHLNAQAIGARLVVDGGALNVLPGCEGVDLALLSVSAALVAPMAFHQRLLGLLLMLGSAFLLNQLRLQVLLQVHLHQPAWFDPLHALWLPLSMVAVLSALFLAWTSRLARW